MKQTSYKEAVTEIESILSELNSSSIDVDTLVEKIEIANKLIALCKSKLQKASDGIDKIVLPEIT